MNKDLNECDHMELYSEIEDFEIEVPVDSRILKFSINILQISYKYFQLDNVDLDLETNKIISQI